MVSILNRQEIFAKYIKIKINTIFWFALNKFNRIYSLFKIQFSFTKICDFSAPMYTIQDNLLKFVCFPHVIQFSGYWRTVYPFVCALFCFFCSWECLQKHIPHITLSSNADTKHTNMECKYSHWFWVTCNVVLCFFFYKFLIFCYDIAFDVQTIQHEILSTILEYSVVDIKITIVAHCIHFLCVFPL